MEEKQEFKKVDRKKVDSKIVYKKPVPKDAKPIYPILKNGLYECEYLGTFEEIRDNIKYFSHRWKEVTTSKWVSEISNTAFTPQSKLHKIFEALDIEVKEGQEVDFSQLIGKRCQLYLVREERTKTKTGEKFMVNTIKDHVKLEKPVSTQKGQSTLSP